MITAKTVMVFGIKSLLKEWERLRDGWDKLTFTEKTNGDFRLLCNGIGKLQQLISEVESGKEGTTED